MAARKRRNGMNARPKVEAQSNNIIRPYSDAGSHSTEICSSMLSRVPPSTPLRCHMS